jgi:cell division transport system ATP-binding protein
MIEFCEVTKTYGKPGKERPAVQELSFYVQAGDFALLMGPSGAGKSTILKLILAMERPDTGSISVAGRDVHRLTRGSIPYLRRNLGVVFQDFKLLQEASPIENVSLALQILGIGRAETRRRAAQALERVNLDPDTRKPVRQMSGGEQQRVALARALAGNPPILLADEPTGNLDPALTRDVLDALDQIRREGTTILMATHDPLVRDHVGASRLVYIEDGRLLRNAPLSRARADTGETDAVAIEVAEPASAGQDGGPSRAKESDDVPSANDPPPTRPIGSSALADDAGQPPFAGEPGAAEMGETEIEESELSTDGIAGERHILDALLDDDDDRILSAMVDDEDAEASGAAMPVIDPEEASELDDRDEASAAVSEVA